MGLADLSEEVLAFIFELESEHRISTAPFHAYLTGNRKLRAKMDNGGIDVVTYKKLKWKAPLRVPEFVKQWRLRRLYIYAPSSTLIASKSSEPGIMSAIYPWRNLTALELDISGADSLFFQIPPSSTSTTTDTGVTSSTQHTSDTQLPSDALSSSSIYSNLQYLRIIVSPSMDILLLMAAIPRSLTALGINYIDTYGERYAPPATFAALPELKEIAFPSNFIDSNNIGTLPKSITEIVHSCFTEEAFNMLLRDWQSFLPIMRSFPFDGNVDDAKWYNDLDTVDANGNYAEDITHPFTFPSNVLHLDFSNLPINYLIPLPIRLQDLSMLSQPPIDRHTMTKWLPPTITSLQAAILWTGVEPHHWPRSLKSLTLPIISTDNTHQLPRALEYLEIEDFRAAEQQSRPVMLLENPIDRQRWLESKEKLFKRCKPEKSNERALIERYINEAESGAFLNLPLSLTALSVYRSNAPELKDLALPPNVTYARIDGKARVLPWLLALKTGNLNLVSNKKDA